MFLGIAGFEWRYATRRITFAAAALVLAVLGYVLAATGFGAQDVHVNSAYALTYSIGFLSLTSVFALTVLVAPSLLRDIESGMAEIVYSTAMTKAQYLGGRMAGSFAAAATAFLFGIAGLAAGALLSQPPDRLAPFHAAPYLWAYAVFALPSMAFVAALLFAIAALTRSTLATYIGGVVVYVLYFAAAVMAGSPLLASSGPVSAREMAIAALADPFGLSALFEQTRYWTAAERDARPLSLAGSLLLNRVLWSGATAALLVAAYRAFSFRVQQPRRREEDDEAPSTIGAAPYRPVAVAASTPRAALLSAVRIEAGSLVRAWPFLAVVILWAGAALMTLFEELRRAEYGTALVPAASLILRHLHQPLLLFGVLVIVYFAGEIVWRERSVHVAEIVDATPAGNALFFTAKTLALVALVGILVAVGIAVALGLQLTAGDRGLQPALLATSAYFDGLPLALFAVLAILVQTLAPNRHAGLLVTLAAAVFLPLGGPGGPSHPLLRFGFLGTVPHSEMGGFGPALRVFGFLAVYWTSFAMLIAIAAIGAWRRGTDGGSWARLRAIPRRLDRRARVAAAVGAAVFAATGAFLFHQMNVVSAYETPEDRLAWRAEYERRYAGMEARPQPRLVHIDAEVELFPSERRYRVRGRYRLENHGDAPITSVLASVPAGVRVSAMTLDGRAAATDDARFRARTFAAALGPGATAELAFDVEADRRSASADTENDVVENGTFVFGPSVMPALGYREGYEIDDAPERARRGLPARPVRAPREPELVTYEVVASAPADQVIVAPGVVRATGEKDGRRWTRFASLRPSQPILAFAAARYAVATTTSDGVVIEVLHHPAHAANVPRILDAARQSLAYCAREYGPYPYPALRIAETPAYDERFGGYALPGVVYLTEDRAFLTDLRDPGRIDIVTKRVAHEVAHQWFGHQAIPMDGPGALAIVETPARYTELMVLEERYGPASLRPVLQVELGRYLSGRRGEAEVPLDRVEGQAYLYYAKGALAMTALAAMIGEGNVNAALRAIVVRANGGGAPTADDLHEELRRVTPAAQRARLDELLSGTVLYDLRVVNARVTPLAGGRFRVDARIEGLPAPGDVEVAVYAGHPDRTEGPLATATVTLGAIGDVAIVTSARPEYVVVDPELRFIDRNPDDNLFHLP